MKASLCARALSQAVFGSLAATSRAAAATSTTTTTAAFHRRQQQARQAPSAQLSTTAAAVKAKVHFTFLTADGITQEVFGREGDSLLDAALRHSVSEVEGLCEGSGECSTCMISLEPEVFTALGAVSEAEQDMLDQCSNTTATSRLGCQVKLSKIIDGAIVTIPEIQMNQCKGD